MQVLIIFSALQSKEDAENTNFQVLGNRCSKDKAIRKIVLKWKITEQNEI